MSIAPIAAAVATNGMTGTGSMEDIFIIIAIMVSVEILSIVFKRKK